MYTRSVTSVFRMLVLLATLYLTGTLPTAATTPTLLLPPPTSSDRTDWGSPPPAHDTTAVPSQQIIHVPSDMGIQQAINQISDGGIIEIASGTYPAPDGGFKLGNLGKSFTIRAAMGATVKLDGSNAGNIIWFVNSSLSSGKLITFERLIFANGYSNTPGTAGGVTMDQAEAVFANCVWDSNTVMIYGGGLTVHTQSKAYVHGSRFTNNRANLPGHDPYASGGAIHVVNSTLSISDSSFEGNEAGYVGGAIYALGTWVDPVSIPHTSVIVESSTFTGNHAVRSGTLTTPPTESGAIHVEGQAIGTIVNSRFISNVADVAGAIGTYRGRIEIDGSFFQDNRAVGIGSANGFGGAIAAFSADIPADGDINRPPAHLTIRDTVIANSSLAGQVAGGVYAAGDFARTYGSPGVSQIGTAAENRATVIISNTIFHNTDVTETVNGGGTVAAGTGDGGALLGGLVDLTMQHSLIIFADAFGSHNSSGGGLALLDQSVAHLVDITIARSTTGKFGGGVFVQGSTIYLNNCRLIENQFTVPANQVYGAAIFSAPDDGRVLPVAGALDNCTISNNTGLPIFDDDRTNGPINDMRYNSNQIYSTTFGDLVYRDVIAGSENVAGLNTLVVNRANGTSTDKSQFPNTAPSQPPVVGTILAIPNCIIPGSSSTYYLGYAWSGGPATLDGVPVSGNAGLTQKSGVGIHTLLVSSTPFTVQVCALTEKVFLPGIMR